MDNGSQFTSKKFIKQLKDLNIKPCFVSIRHPQASPVERLHKSINRFFRTLIKNKHTEWAKWVPIIMNIINETHHEVTEFTPLEIHLNKKPTRFWEKFIKVENFDKNAYEHKLFLTKERILKKGKKEMKKLILNTNM